MFLTKFYPRFFFNQFNNPGEFGCESTDVEGGKEDKTVEHIRRNRVTGSYAAKGKSSGP